MTPLPRPPPEPPAGAEPGSARQRAGLIAGLVLFAAVLALPAPDGMSPQAWRVAATALLMATWWITEAIPVAATALLPPVLFPVLGASTIGAATAPYANPLIFLFMGGFMIALAMQRWDLHRRIALNIVRVTGTSAAQLAAGFMIATAFLSMWVSNTATTVMMLPIALSVIGLLAAPGEGPKEGPGDGFAVALLLGIAYAASIGGLATLIGTPPNALLAAFMADRFGVEIGFARWMLVGVPLSAAMLAVAWLLLTRVLFRMTGGDIPGAAEVIRREIAALGPMRPPEWRVAVVFALTAAAWIGRPVLAEVVPQTAALSDAGIAVTGALALFVLPAGGGEGSRLLDWEWARRLPWNVLILFGGGLSLAAAINGSGLAGWIGAAMEGLRMVPMIAVVVAVTATVVLVTELTSNTATAATFLPLVAALAATVDADPLRLTVPAALAASCAFMMPVATPPNAIVYGSGLLSVPQMARAGLWLNIAAVALITAAAYSLIAWVFAV